MTDIREQLQKADVPSRELDEEIALAIQYEFPTWASFQEHWQKHDYLAAWTAHASWRQEFIPKFTSSYDFSLPYLESRELDWIIGNVNGHYGGTPYAQVGNAESSYSGTPLLALWLATIRILIGDEREATTTGT